MHSRYVSWSRYATLAGLVFALVLVIPVTWFPFQLAKIAAFALCLCVAAVLFVVGGGARDLVRTHGFYLGLLVLLLPLSYLLSWALSLDGSVGLTGFSLETDTVFFVLLAALAYLLSMTLFRTLRTARVLSLTIFWALAAAVVFQFISIFGHLPLGSFSDTSANLIGKLNDLGLLATLLGLMLMIRLHSSLSSLGTGLAAVAGVLLVLLLALINFPFAWGLLLAGSLVLGLIAWRTHMPWPEIIGVVVALIFLLYGSAINGMLTKAVPLSSLEVRPGLQSTLTVIDQTRAGSLEHLLVGLGPNTFGEAWLADKPTEVNQTPFWNLDFNVGFSTLATAFGTVGLLGALMWLIPLALLVVALLRALWLGVLSREEREVTLYLSVMSFFLLTTLVLYVPSSNLVLLAFVLSGATFGFLWRQGRSTPDEAAVSSRKEGLLILSAAAVLLVCSVLTAFVGVRRFVAQAYTSAGLSVLAQDNDVAIARAQSAIVIESTPDALRLRADAGAQKLRTIAQDTKLTPDQAKQAFTNELQASVSAAQQAIVLTPGDYRGYLSLAQIYDLLASLKVQGAYESAQTAYAAAAVHNPTSPAIPLAQARLEAGHGNGKGVEDALKRSLTLKPDYTDAILFVVQINVAQNDLASAVRNTQAALKTAPGVASIWFELGVLYWAGNDFKDAQTALQQAVTLDPNNADIKAALDKVIAKQPLQTSTTPAKK